MNENIRTRSIAQRSPILRFIRWLFTPRTLGRLLCGFAILATLAGLYYIEENWRGKRAWQACKQQIEASGIRMEVTAYVPPDVPEEQNFAATPFFAPLFDFAPGTQNWRDTNAYHQTSSFAKDLSLGTVKGNWEAGKRADINSWLADYVENRRATGADIGSHEEMSPEKAAATVLKIIAGCDPVLNELREAAKRPYCRFAIRYDHEPAAQILLPHLALIKQLTQLLRLRAVAELTLGQTDAAMADLMLAFDLTDSVQNEPFLISWLVRQACFRITAQVVWEGLAEHKWTDTQLQQLQNRLQRFDFLAEAKDKMCAELAWANRLIDEVKRVPNWLLDENDPPWVALFIGLLPRGWFYFEHVNYTDAFQRMILPVLVDNPARIDPAQVKQNAKQLEALAEDRPIFKHRFFINYLMPSLEGAFKRAAHAQSAVNMAILGCALERYRLANGQFPDALNKLLPDFAKTLPNDPITGTPLKYRLTEDGGFVLYSIGWNQADDGGIIAMESSRRQDISAGDWVWQYPE